MIEFFGLSAIALATVDDLACRGVVAQQTKTGDLLTY